MHRVVNFHNGVCAALSPKDPNLQCSTIHTSGCDTSVKFSKTAKLSIMWALGHTLTAGLITVIIFFVSTIFQSLRFSPKIRK